MSVVRRIARPLIAAQFVYGGVDVLRHPQARAELAEPVLNKLAPALGLPNDPVLLTRANAGAQAVAGTLLGLSRFPRLSALVLALSLVPTTAAGHRFWEQDDPAKRAQHRIHFLKNASMLGGLLLAVVDTDGRPGLTWRARRAAQDARRTARLTGKQARQTARAARREARLAGARAGDALPFG